MELLDLLPFSIPSSYMHQALDGAPLELDRPFIPTVQVQRRSNKLKISIIVLIRKTLRDRNVSLSRLETRLIRCVTLDFRATSLACKVLDCIIPREALTG